MDGESLSIRKSGDVSLLDRPLVLTITNFVLFQIGWFACVLSAAAFRPWVGALVALTIVTVHVLRANPRVAELKLILCATAIGAMVDSTLVWLGWIEYPSGMVIPNAAPYWIVLMWTLFATLLNISLRWLRGRWLIAALAGAAGGPLAFYAGHRLGALEFGNESAALIGLAVAWAVITPLLLALSERFDGYAWATAGRTS